MSGTSSSVAIPPSPIHLGGPLSTPTQHVLSPSLGHSPYMPMTMGMNMNMAMGFNNGLPPYMVKSFVPIAVLS